MPDEPESISFLRIGLKHVDVCKYVEQDELLRRSPLLRPLSEQERVDLLQGSKAVGVKCSRLILREGRPADAVWLILDGDVSLTLGDGITDLGMLGKGDFFGISAIDPHAACPRARAESDVRLAGLQPEQIGLLQQLVPELAREIATVSKARNALADGGVDFLDRW